MIFEFGGYELDTARLEVRRGGDVLPVEPQVFDVLAYLVANRDRVVSKEELLDNIWGDRFVSESALTSRIKTARRLIGDDGSRQNLIRTVYGRGYRFIATIDGSGAAGVNHRPMIETHAVAAGTVLATVGRDAEIAQLRNLVQGAHEGERCVVFIAWVAGIGKTTLADRLLTEIDGDGAVVGVGQCVEHRGGGEAYLPVFEAVHQICTSPAGSSVLSHLIERAPTWVTQMPGLVPADDEAGLRRSVIAGGRHRMLREMLDALHAAAHQTLVVLVLEDLHWSDSSTLDLLDAIAMDRRPCRLLVVGTHRPSDAASASRAVHGLAVGLRLRGRAELLTLDALNEADVAELLEARLGGSAPIELAALLHDRTGGVPLFAERLLDSWLDDGSIAPAVNGTEITVDVDALATRVPDSVRQLIEHAFDRLDADQQAIVSAASVAGREFAAAEVAAATGRTEDEVESLLADLGRGGHFVQPRGDCEWPDHTVTARFAFEHDLHREVLYGRIGPSRTATLHRAIGERLERAFGDDRASAATLAAHFLAAADASRALRYCTLAAEHQLQRSAHREAIEHLRCAREMAARLPATRSRAEEELRLNVALGNALITAKGYAAAETADVYAQARRLCEQLGDGPHFLPVLYGLWNNALVGGQHPSAYELATSFLELARRLDDEAIIVAERAVGWPLLFMGRATEARQHLERIPAAIDPARTAALIANYGEDPAAAGQATLSWARWFTGDDAGAQRASLESLQRARSVDHPLSEVYTLVVAAVLDQLRDDPAAAEHHAGRAIEISQQHAIPVFEALAKTPLGWARHRHGDADAIGLVRDGLAATSATGTGVLQPLALATLGQLLTEHGEIDDALATLDDAMAVATASGETFYTPEIERLRSDALLEAGNQTQAFATAVLAVERAQDAAAIPFLQRAKAALSKLDPHKRALR